MAPILPPPWHKIYPRHTPVAWLTDIITSHARATLVALADCRSATVGPPSANAVPPDFNNDRHAVSHYDATDGCNDVPPLLPRVDVDAPLDSQLAYAASCVWRKHKLRPNQLSAVDKLVYDNESGGKILLVDRTGGGGQFDPPNVSRNGWRDHIRHCSPPRSHG